MEQADIDNRFNYHPPSHDGIKRAHEDVREGLRLAANVVNELCPEGREKSLAITKLEEAMMWSNAAIARKQSINNEKG